MNDEMLKRLDVEKVFGHTADNMFDSTTRRSIWAMDDAKSGYTVFVSDTNGINKNKLLHIINSLNEEVVLWRIDGVLFARKTKCDCAFLHSDDITFVEFKVNAKNNSADTIEQHYNKAANQLKETFLKFCKLYGDTFWDVFNDANAIAVFDPTVPQDNAMQKSLRSLLADVGIDLQFMTELEIKYP